MFEGKLNFHLFVLREQNTADISLCADMVLIPLNHCTVPHTRQRKKSASLASAKKDHDIKHSGSGADLYCFIDCSGINMHHKKIIETVQTGGRSFFIHTKLWSV